MDTSPLRSAQPQALQVRGDFVMLRADTLRLLLPQHDVNDTEYLERAPQATAQAGVFAVDGAGGETLQVAALSAQMRLLPAFPTGRFLLTRLSGDSRDLALAWTDMRVMIDAALELHPIPPVLRGASGVVDAYVEIDGEIAFCTTAERVLAEVQNAGFQASQESGSAAGVKPVRETVRCDAETDQRHVFDSTGVQ